MKASGSGSGTGVNRVRNAARRKGRSVAPRRKAGGDASSLRSRRPEDGFSSLSVEDLLDARDAYHVHLSHLQNVIATAVGPYRIVGTDPDARDARRVAARGRTRRRTLQNTIVAPWSWPSVLVFVDGWLDPKDFARCADEIVPPRLYLPDGRVVPTCVIYAERHPKPVAPPRRLLFPASAIGGGYPVLAEVQGTTHVGTLGCLVSDGDALFALTDRHVTGEVGRELYTLVQGEREPLGRTDARSLRKLPFAEAYPGWTGTNSHANLDAGLIRVDDSTRWTSQVYGIGEFGELADLSTDTLSLDLVGRPVCAYGAASGLMEGEVQALFYRYRTVGGADYVADLLIGPRAGRPAALARHGNSGAVWFLGEPPKPGDDRPRSSLPRPLALHWGGQTLVEPGGAVETEFALATLLSTVCRELDVDVVRDLNLGLPETWGKLGHYTIGAAAVPFVTNKRLAAFLDKNLDRISFSAHDLLDLDTALKRRKFVALADVPDIIWKERGPRKRGREGPNHFADMDEESARFGGKTLLELCSSPARLEPALWKDFYDSINVKGRNQGLLPFRVWQLYDAMVEALGRGDVTAWLCAAGVLAHYIADACQPLHVSRLHDGHPDTGEGEGVHSAYETKMIDRFATDVVAKVDQALKAERITPISSGREAGFETVKLMKRSTRALPPETIIKAFTDNPGRGRIAALWDALGEATCERMADGAALLASIWQGAWVEGGGARVPAAKLKPVSTRALARLYENPDFAPSLFLEMLEAQGDRLVVQAGR